MIPRIILLQQYVEDRLIFVLLNLVNPTSHRNDETASNKLCVRIGDACVAWILGLTSFIDQLGMAEITLVPAEERS